MIEEHHSANIRRIDWPVFLKGKRTPVSVEHNLRSGLVTLDVCGKPQKSWQVQKFEEAFDVPHNFTHDDHKFTLKKQVDEDGTETENLELDIDGQLFMKYPFVDKDFGKCF